MTEAVSARMTQPDEGARMSWRTVSVSIIAIGICAATLLSSNRSIAESAASPARNVVLVVCDTLRADHLSLYGYHRDTSPFLDWLGQKGHVYQNAYSHFPYTWPTV